MIPLHPLSPRARALFHAQALSRLALFWLPVTGVATAIGATVWSVQGALAVAALFLFFQFLLAVWWPWLSFSRWGYRLEAGELLVGRGVLVRSVTAIPLGRVQHVDVRQGPLEQWLGLARVQVHTASGAGADGVIPGLELQEAERLRDELVARARDDDGV